MELRRHDLHQPLIAGDSSSEAAPPMSRGLIFLTLVATLSIWANYEASKGFEISILNDAGEDTPLGRHLSLFFLSNDEATRVVLRATHLSHRLLYPNHTHHHHHPIKPVRRITVRLSAASRNLTRRPIQEVVTEKRSNDEYVIGIQVGESVVGRYDNVGIVKAIERGVARVWVWDGNGGAPAEVVEGLAELVVGSEWELGEVGEFWRCCAGLNRGFVGRLNQAMREGWDERMVDDAAGLPAQRICGSYHGHMDDGILASS